MSHMAEGRPVVPHIDPAPIYTTNPHGRRDHTITCFSAGHDFHHVIDGGNHLMRVYCERCHQAWEVR